jgi:mono/diheme cytochrome c family protein
MLTFLKCSLVAILTGLFVAIALISSGATLAEQEASGDLTTPEGVYTAACVACHGVDGKGSPQERVGFDLPLPDFSDCNFATREPDADWFAIVHQGGPTRGFADNMPAFGQALSDEQLTMAIDYVHTFCDEPAWPRGDLNFPRAIITEKAFPEDELLLTTKINAEGDGSFEEDILYERRFGAANQFEVKVPIKALENNPDGGWNGGIGDVELGVKRVLAHSKNAGFIFSFTGAVLLPVGDSEKGMGKGTTIFEPFLTAGFALPSDSFIQLQGGVELSADTEKASNEAFYRAVVGKTFTQGRFGRSWTPMLEILAGSEFGDEGTEYKLDLLPELQVTLNTRQHIMANFGVRFPVTEAESRDTQILFYLLWDWFDGGFLDGW